MLLTKSRIKNIKKILKNNIKIDNINEILFY